jgi:hypothetical protein
MSSMQKSSTRPRKALFMYAWKVAGALVSPKVWRGIQNDHSVIERLFSTHLLRVFELGGMPP